VISTDVVVVGAGPAGSAAAIHLARAGLDVTVIDKATFPRDKCCGDGLTTLALRLLDSLGLEPGAVESWNRVDRATIRAPSGRELNLTMPTGRGQFVAVAKRRDLDHALVELSRTAGATVLEAVGLASIAPAIDHIGVTTTTGEMVRARYIVAADGMWSPTRRALGMDTPGYRGEWHGFRQYMKAKGTRSRDLWVWFEPDLLPGYAWSFPLPNGQVNVGFGVVRKTARNGKSTLSGSQMASTWSGLLRRGHIREVLDITEVVEPHRAWPIPARLPRTSLTGPRTLFVGDAAAATDPLTGEGIGQALETGLLAAQAIITGGATRPAAVCARYDISTRQRLTADHKMASALSSVLGSAMATNAALATVGANKWTRSNFARWMFEDYPRALIATPGRWNSDTFRRDGASFTGRQSST